MHKFTWVFILLLNLPIFAASIPLNSNQLGAESYAFDVVAANKDFDKMNLTLSTKGPEQATLKKAVKTLKTQITNADDCIRINEKKATNLDIQIQEATQSNQPTDKLDKDIIATKSTVDLVYLTKERKKIANNLAQCRLFSIRANEALEVYQATLSQLKKQKILEHGQPFWANIRDIFTKNNNLGEINLKVTDIPKQLLLLRTLYVILGTSFLLAALIFYKAYNSVKARHYISIKKIRFHSFLVLFAGLTCLTTTSYLNFLSTETNNWESFFLPVINSVTIYLLTLFMVIVFFNLKKIKAFFCGYSLNHKFFKLLTIFVISLYTVTVIGKMLAKQLAISRLTWDVGQSIFLYLELTLASIFVFYFCHAHRQIYAIKKYKTLIKTISTVMFITFGFINLIGYNLLSVHLTFSGILTFAIIFATIILEQTITKFYNMCTSDKTTNSKLQYIFGYKSEQNLTEIVILKTTIQTIIFLGALYLISQSWGYALDSIDTIFKYILYGVKFENFTFNPARVISGIILFCILHLIFRSISATISRHKQFDGEEETQVAVASLLTYIGFAVAIISALLISGFDFTGLAIVAGALSVGIGLGLQSIVNNFVSGLILLIEKPIKPGDKISIDGIDGYVKKIRQDQLKF